MQIDSITITKEIFFVSKYLKSLSGYNLGVEGAKQVLGFSVEGKKRIVLTNEKLKELLPQILKSKKVLYCTPSLPDSLFDQISNMKFAAVSEVRKELEEKYPNLTIKSSRVLSERFALRKIFSRVSANVESSRCYGVGMH